MKTFIAQSILLFSLSITCGVYANYWNGSLPDGYLLAISVIMNDDLKSDDIAIQN